MGWFYGLNSIWLSMIVVKSCHVRSHQKMRMTGNQFRVLCKYLSGKLVADRGYISRPLFEQLLETFNVQLITRLKKNMKNRLMPWLDKLLLRKRAIIESVIDQIKNISQIEHTCHRSPINAFINIIADLIAYCHQPKKPSLNIIPSVLPLLVA